MEVGTGSGLNPITSAACAANLVGFIPADWLMIEAYTLKSGPTRAPCVERLVWPFGHGAHTHTVTQGQMENTLMIVLHTVTQPFLSRVCQAKAKFSVPTTRDLLRNIE